MTRITDLITTEVVTLYNGRSLQQACWLLAHDAYVRKYGDWVGEMDPDINGLACESEIRKLSNRFIREYLRQAGGL